MNIRFDGKRVCVTGAGKGIGREISLLLAELGAQVLAVSRTQGDLDELQDQIGCEVFQCDLSDAMAATIAAEKCDRIDLLVNNAGVSFPQSFLETTTKAFDETIAINVRAALIFGQIAAQDMIARGEGGAIVNVSSQASKIGLRDHAAYCASKGALDQLTRVMAEELGEHKIRVNAVNPTVTMTPMGQRAWSDPVKRNPMLAKIPLGKFAQPRDVAHAVAYLLSEQADMIHGACLPIDGGFLAT